MASQNIVELEATEPQTMIYNMFRQHVKKTENETFLTKFFASMETNFTDSTVFFYRNLHEEEDPKQGTVCRSFCYWFLGNCLTTLSHPKICKAVQESCISCQQKLLKLILKQEPFEFVRCVKEYTRILQELTDIWDKFFRTHTQASYVVQGFTPLEVSIKDLDLSFKPISLKSAEVCLHLRQGTLRIITTALSGISLYSRFLLPTLFTLTYDGLVYGGIQLLETSLSLAVALLSKSSQENSELLTVVLEPILDLLCSKEQQKEAEASLFQGEEVSWRAIEAVFGSFLLLMAEKHLVVHFLYKLFQDTISAVGSSKNPSNLREPYAKALAIVLKRVYTLDPTFQYQNNLFVPHLLLLLPETKAALKPLLVMAYHELSLESRSDDTEGKRLRPNYPRIDLQSAVWHQCSLALGKTLEKGPLTRAQLPSFLRLTTLGLKLAFGLNRDFHYPIQPILDQILGQDYLTTANTLLQDYLKVEQTSSAETEYILDYINACLELSYHCEEVRRFVPSWRNILLLVPALNPSEGQPWDSLLIQNLVLIAVCHGSTHLQNYLREILKRPDLQEIDEVVRKIAWLFHGVEDVEWKINTLDSFWDSQPFQSSQVRAKAPYLICAVLSETQSKLNGTGSYHLACAACQGGDAQELNPCFAKFSPKIIRTILEGEENSQLVCLASLNTLWCHRGITLCDFVNTVSPCLTSISQPVRRETVKTLKFVMSHSRAVESEDWTQINTQLQQFMVTACKNVPDSGDLAKEDTLLDAVTCVMNFGSPLVYLKLLMRFAYSSSSFVAQSAVCAISNLAKSSGSTPRLLFCKYKPEICQHLIQLTCVELHGTLMKAAILCVVIFQLEREARLFLSQSMAYMLPPLFYYISNGEANPEHVDFILSATAKHKASVLSKQFAYIYEFMCRNGTMDQQTACIALVEKISGYKLPDLIKANTTVIVYKVLMHFSNVSSKSVKILRDLTTHLDVICPSQDARAVVDFVAPRFLGYFVYLDTVLLNASESLQIAAVSSFPCVFKLMGPEHVTPIRLKIFATLKTALKFSSSPFLTLTAQAWEAFVKNIVEGELGPLVVQIVATLLPYYSRTPVIIGGIFGYLIVESFTKFEKFIKDLHFFPDLPGLEHVSQAIRRTLPNKTNTREYLSTLMESLNYEDMDVRVHNLVQLKQVLREPFVREMILGSDTVDPLIIQLLSVLMAGCRQREEALHLHYAECLGALGAIDPGRLHALSELQENCVVVYESVCHEDFAHDLISEITRMFLSSSNSAVLDSCSYVLQELLKLYGIRSPNESDSQTWNSFPPQMQTILKPLLTSCYVCSNIEKRAFRFPIYKSSSGCTYEDWVRNWTYALMNTLQASKPLSVFQACRILISNDLQITLYLLPYILVTAILEGNETQRTSILKEVLTVLEDNEVKITSMEQSGELKRKETNKGVEANLHVVCSQVIFCLLDHLNQWCRHRKEKSTSASKSRAPKDFLTIKRFVDAIPNELLAQTAYKCHAYARALMHLDLAVKAQPESLQNHLSFLQQIYVALDEPDGVSGVLDVLTTEPTLQQRIIAHEATGRLQDAYACYERLGSESNEGFRGMLKCYSSLSLPRTVLALLDGLEKDNAHEKQTLENIRAEAYLKLGQWSKLAEMPCRVGEGWGVGLGHTLLLAKEKGSEDPSFAEHLKALRTAQMKAVSAASLERGTYGRTYQHLVSLHMLTDVEDAVKANIETENSLNLLFRNMEQRISSVQASTRFLGPVLSLQRAILNVVAERAPQNPKIQEFMGHSWLRSVRLTRNAGHYQSAYSFLLDIKSITMVPANVYVEEAKLCWAKGEKENAISVLKRGMDQRCPDILGVPSNTPVAVNYAKAKLLLARYCEETSCLDMEDNLNHYKHVVRLNDTWEDGYFYLGRYYDRILKNVKDTEKRRYGLLFSVVECLGKSLEYGDKFIYQSLPRMLSLWLEFGAQVVAMDTKHPHFAEAKSILQRMTRFIGDCSSRLPAYKFLTAFPQLISRICHTHSEVYGQLREIVAHLLVSYRQQAMWMMIAVLKSSHPMRRKRCQQIVDLACKKDPLLVKFMANSTRLADELIKLANQPVSMGASTLSISKVQRDLPRMLKDPNFSEIMVPLQWVMNVSLPTKAGAQNGHNPFPRPPVYIKEIEDTVEIIFSLVKPKKITFIGSDGKSYIMICKPKDDLRKDCRLMEFNQIVNRCLLRDPEARRRNLYIRTYTVVPLNEECGLIEWLPNLTGLRHVLIKIYKNLGGYVTGSELKNNMPRRMDSLAKKLELFQNFFLAKHPAVFDQWFVDTFPDPQSWFLARSAYVKTTAVMSMVGFVLGLGDRHGENILFDSHTGDTVHVDFNCLFNKGMTFEWPEVVPFRLTHNMVKAMGPTGVEGPYRKTCEITMKVLRDEADTLLSVLRPMLYDPLVEWKGSGTKSDTGEIFNEQAVESLTNIEKRLQGKIGRISAHALSVEGQVDQLINEAMDVNKLAQMYIGWAAYM